MNIKDIVAAVRDHAVRNYNVGGWDYVVETYDDKELIEEIGDAATPEEAIRRIGEIVGSLDSYRRDIQAEAW